MSKIKKEFRLSKNKRKNVLGRKEKTNKQTNKLTNRQTNIRTNKQTNNQIKQTNDDEKTNVIPLWDNILHEARSYWCIRI